MSCCFENTLHYSSPGHGDWGVVRIGMLAPESVQLFVCPSACGRHVAIGAMKQGLKDRLFYLYVSQSDIVDGYDPLIPEAVKNVLEALKKQPKVFFYLCELPGRSHRDRPRGTAGGAGKQLSRHTVSGLPHESHFPGVQNTASRIHPE